MAETEDFEWDDAKERRNLRKHGFAFTDALELFISSDVLEGIDDRFNYEEERTIAFGRLKGRVVCCVYTWRGVRRRIISLRKADARETRRYEETLRSS